MDSGKSCLRDGSCKLPAAAGDASRIVPISMFIKAFLPVDVPATNFQPSRPRAGRGDHDGHHQKIRTLVDAGAFSIDIGTRRDRPLSGEIVFYRPFRFAEMHFKAKITPQI